MNLLVLKIQSSKSKFQTMYFLIFLYSTVLFAENSFITPVKERKIQKEIDTISTWVALPFIVNAVIEQNTADISMDTILKRDAEWIKNVESKRAPSMFMKRVINNPVGKWLKNLRKSSRGKYRECFLCDNKGALVASGDVTTDYYQGDESKWIDCFNKGDGKPIYCKPQYDQSADALLVQISVPVKNKGETIGVLVVGIRLRSLK